MKRPYTNEGRASIAKESPTFVRKTSNDHYIQGTPNSVHLALPLLAAVVVSDAKPVTMVLNVLTPATIFEFDAPTAIALNAAHQLAAADVRPTALAVNTRLSETGQHTGHRGRLVADRVLDVIGHAVPTGRTQAAVLASVARPVAEELLMARLFASGTAQVVYRNTAHVYDAMSSYARDHQRIVDARNLVERLRVLAKGASE